MDPAATFALIALLVLALLAVASLGWRYVALKARLGQEAMALHERWRADEMASLMAEQARLAKGEAAVALDQWKLAYSQQIRAEAVRQSQVVTMGKVTEHFIPYLPEFEFNPKDARFLGSPIDFLVFDGLNEGEVRSVLFVEVKTGKSALNGRERLVRDAVRAGRMGWLELRMGGVAISGQPSAVSDGDGAELPPP